MPAILKRGGLATATVAAALAAPSPAPAQVVLRGASSLETRTATVATVVETAPATLQLRRSNALASREPPAPAPSPSRSPAPAPSPSPDSAAAAGQVRQVQTFVSLRINGQEQGEHAIFIVGDTDFLVPKSVLAARVPALAGQPAIDVGGEPHLFLSRIAGARWRFDENNLALELTFEPGLFAPQVLRYSASERPAPTESGLVSSILNYQLGVTGSTSGADPQMNAALQGSVRWSEWLLRGGTFHTWGDGPSVRGRGPTALTRDDPVRLTRLTLGDFTTGVSEVAGALVLGGISFARAFDLDPYTVRQPGAAFNTMVDFPSTIDVYVGDARLMRQAVGPGPVELTNLTYLTGRRDVRVVVRDVFGRERDIVFPFYFADRGLAAGVHDFNYGVGAVRRDLAGMRGSYAQLAASAFHRVGLDDRFTAGYQAEATREVQNAGPSLTLRTDRLGIFSLTLLASRERAPGRSGAAGAIGYVYQREALSAGISLRHASDGFALVQAPGSPPPRSEYLASASYSLGRHGTVTASARETRSRLEERLRGGSLGYSLPLTREWILQATLRRETGPRPVREFFVTLQYVQPGRLLGTLSHREERDRRATAVQVGTVEPSGEGVGYSLGAELASGAAGEQRTVTPDVVWNSRYATFQAGMVHTSGGTAGGEGAYRASVYGAIAAVGDRVGFSRRIDDSFAIARIVPPVADVRVYLNQQPMGRTDARGEVFLPQVVSYIANAITIDDRDIPIERSLARKGIGLVPWSRSGTLVPFEAPLTRSITGILRYRLKGVAKPLEYAIVVLAVDGRAVEVPTGKGGDFYFENVAAGDYAAQVEIEGRPCRFTFRIPASEEPFLRLPDVHGCDLD